MKAHKRLMQALKDIENAKGVESNREWNRKYRPHFIQNRRVPLNRAERRMLAGITKP